MDLPRVLVVTCLVVTVGAQMCPESTVVLMLDKSENAQRAATDYEYFDLLIAALVKFFTNDLIASPWTNISIVVYGYSSTGVETIVPQWSNASEAATYVQDFNHGIPSGGSWTYKGLANHMTRPLTTRNIFGILSSQGSGDTRRTKNAVDEANRLRGMDWKIKVFAVQGANNINMNELTAVNNGVIPTIITDSTPGEMQKGYRNLTSVFDTIINWLGCSKDMKPTSPPLTTRQN